MTVTLTPLVENSAVELSSGSGKWRKQILPAGKFNYKGQVLDFAEIGKVAKQSFDDKALDQVAFQLADAGNNHNFDPEKYRGELESVEVTNEGTFGVFDFSKYPDIQDMLKKNPKFGVSARIERDVERGDGKKFSYAFSHVLGTLNPRVTGMKPWEAVSLSNVDENEEVIDLVASEEEKSVTDTKTVMLSADEVAEFRNFVAEQKKIEAALKLSNPDKGDDKSTEIDSAIKLANERVDSALKLAREGQIELAQTRWEKNHDALLRDGVPPAILDKAAVLMSLPASDVAVIELSVNGKTEAVAPQAVVLSILEEVKGLIDLSSENGHQLGKQAEEEEDPGYDKFRDEFFADQF